MKILFSQLSFRYVSCLESTKFRIPDIYAQNIQVYCIRPSKTPAYREKKHFQIWILLICTLCSVHCEEPNDSMQNKNQKIYFCLPPVSHPIWWYIFEENHSNSRKHIYMHSFIQQDMQLSFWIHLPRYHIYHVFSCICWLWLQARNTLTLSINFPKTHTQTLKRYK